MRRLLLLLCVCLCLAGCRQDESKTLADFRSKEVTLASGQKILSEVMMQREEMMRGMMFRDSLAPDHGMLFIHGAPGKYAYWMYQVRIPLDIIWMDRQHRVVEISANTPPCKNASASTCPNYGGHEDAMYVLELAGGMAAKYGVRVGDTINF